MWISIAINIHIISPTLAEVKIMKSIDLSTSGQNGKWRGYFKAQLAALKSEFIHEVRGKGLMIAVELTREAGGARQFCEALKTRGILCKETHDHIIRFSPPLVLTN